MGEAFFYHLTASPVEDTLTMLLGKCLGAGWRVAVRGTRDETLERLDQRLWTHPPDGFLPHGLAGGPHDSDQPVLLTTQPDLPNAAQCVISIDGAPVEPGEVSALARVCIVFDGHDNMALERARAQWKAITRAGCVAQYWAQEDGRWRKKA